MAAAKGALKPTSELNRRLGRQFRNIREGKGLGLRPLAATMQVSFYCIRRHEAGAMMLRTDDLWRAADVMGVRPTELLYIDREGIDDGRA